MTSIPASADVAVQPGVLSGGGSPLSLNAIIATQSTRPPIGSRGPIPVKFPNAAAVGAYFGLNSTEYELALVYFSGFTNCTALPGALFYGQYAENAVAGYLRSGSWLNAALATLQALSGILTIAIDGMTVVSANINLSGAASFSAAATLIQTGLQTPGGIWSGTATLVNTSEVMTVVSTVSGQLYIGAPVTGTDIPVGTTVASFGTYTTMSGVGTVNLSQAATGTVGSAESVLSTSAATVNYDGVLGVFNIVSGTTGATSTVAFPTTNSFSTGLLLTQVEGAVLSLGSAAQTPAGFFNAMVAQTQNWVTLLTAWEPLLSEKIAFAAAVNAASPAGNERFVYAGETTEVSITEGPAPSSYPVQTAAYNGRVALYSEAPTVLSDGTVVGDTYGKLAAFIAGAIASINWGALNGRITFKFRNNSQLVPSVVDLTTAENLDANGGNLAANGTSYYAAVATANQQFQYLRQGGISGEWDWIDEYVDQIYLNSQFQLALLNLLVTINAAPYAPIGYNEMRAAMSDPINEALNNGSIVKGVVLSGAQIAAFNAAVGPTAAGSAATTLFQQGWYLQILDPGAQARTNRTTPNATFWYTDGGAIQSINLASIDVQ
jgi:Protein of unknown function (DUF3383)